ncbi:MAG: hypothetical protein ACRCW2_13210 [Cellulosilyticaceae bacterium]
MKEKQDRLFEVGRYKKEFNDILNTELPCKEIYQSIGLVNHVERRHLNCVKYMESIAEIIDCPDYIGVNPKELNSIELIKRYEDNVLVAIKLDIQDEYLYIASVYDIKEVKIARRLHSGRIKEFKLDN